MGLSAGELDVALKAKDGISPVVGGVGKNVGGLMGIVSRFRGLITAAFAVAAVAAVGKFAKSSYDYFKNTGAAIMDFTRLTGASVAQSSLMINLAKRFGVEGSAMGGAFKFLTKNIQSALDGSSTLQTSFSRLGLSMQFIKTHSPVETFMKARDALSKMTNVNMRNAAAASIFGRGFQGLLKIIAKTPAEVKEATKFITDLGLVWTKGKLEMFKDDAGQQKKNALMWDAIKLSASSVIVPLVGKILPLLGKGLMALQGPMDWVEKAAPRAWAALSGSSKKPWDEMSRGQQVLTVVGGALRTFVTSAVSGVKTIVGFFRAHWTGISQVAAKVWGGLVAGVRYVIAVFRPVMTELGATVRVVLARTALWWKAHGSQVIAVMRALGQGVKVVFTLLVGIIKGALNIIAGVIRVVMAVIRGDWHAAWNGIKQIVKGAGQIVGAIIRALATLIVAVLRNAWSAAKAAASAAWNGIVGAVRSGASRVVFFVKSIPGRIVSALGSLGSLLYSAGASIISGLISGITDKLSSLWSTVSGIAGRIRDLKGPLSYDAVLLTPAGRSIMQGLINGIEAQRGALATTLRGVTKDIAGGVSGAAFPALSVAGGYGIAPTRGGAPMATAERRVVYENHYHIHPPGGTAVIGSADDVARMIAPYVTRHQGMAESSSRRQR